MYARYCEHDYSTRLLTWFNGSQETINLYSLIVIRLILSC